jgi:hypothetical protein
MRVLLAGFGIALVFSGCATNRYAEVRHKKPQLIGPPGIEPLATVEKSFARAIREEPAKPLLALGDCLEALQIASAAFFKSSIRQSSTHGRSR